MPLTIKFEFLYSWWHLLHLNYTGKIIEYTLQLKFVVKGENQAPHPNQPKGTLCTLVTGIRSIKCPLFWGHTPSPPRINNGYGPVEDNKKLCKFQIIFDVYY